MDITTQSIDQWAEQGRALQINHKAVLWDIANWMRDGVEKYGDAAQMIAVETFQKGAVQLQRAIDVAKLFPPERRRPELSFGHHEVVMRLDADQADTLLDEAVANKTKVSTLKKAVAEIRESEGGDVFQQMAKIGHEELVDDWNGKMTRLFNRAPSQEARDQFIELAATFENKLIMQ